EGALGSLHGGAVLDLATVSEAADEFAIGGIEAVGPPVVAPLSVDEMSCLLHLNLLSGEVAYVCFSTIGEGAASWPVLAWARDVPNWRLVGRPVRGPPYRLSVERIRVPAGDAGVRLWARGANAPRAHRRSAVVRLAEQLLPVGVGWLTDLGEINLTLPRHADALEAHRRCGQRYGGVEAHLRANAVAGRRVELGTLGFVDKHQIAVGLETRRHCPL